MTHWRKTSGPVLWGNEQPARSQRGDTQYSAANVIPLAILAPGSRSTGSGQSEVRSGGAGCRQAPALSLLSSASLESLKISEALRDKIALAFFSVFLSSVAILFGVVLYVAFFWRA